MACFNRKRQRGLALLFAVLIVVIASTVAVSIVHGEKFTIRKTAHIQTMDRAALYANGLEDVARIFLREDREESDFDSLDESWATGIPGLPIEGGYLNGFIEDEQGKFNLNTLPGSDLAVTRFRRLCDNLDVDHRFVDALVDWIDQDFDVTYPDGAEEHYDSYRVANREIADISELLLVQHVTPEIFELLRPHITALPAATTMNVNTMSETIFQSLGDSLNSAQFIDERESDAYTSIADFIERLELSIEVEGLSVDTQFFRARGQVVQDELQYNLSTLIYRENDGGTKIINRTLGLF